MTIDRHAQLDFEQAQRGVAKLPSVLQQMGYPDLRKGQEVPVYNIMGGRDTICILPTSLGKTAIFVIPTLCLDWRTVVFSPLVALMRDQVRGLWKMGIKAAAMSGNQTPAENAQAIRQWISGELQLFYVAPERLRNADFIEATRIVSPDMVVMDEAHTISAWSDNFRSAYCAIGDFITDRRPKVVAAFTATCPPEVEVDIRRVMGIPDADRIIYYPRRNNLELSSEEWPGEASLAAMLQNVEGSTLTYCATIKNVEKLAADLTNFMGEEVVFYHGEMTPENRRSAQDQWMNNKVRHIVATNAFGMGIDKPDVRFMCHRDHPGSLEALAQEVGRAGRDGHLSRCITFFDPRSLDTQRFFLECGHPDPRDIQAVFNTFARFCSNNELVNLSLKDIAEQAGIRMNVVSSCVQILVGSKVIERVKQEKKLMRASLTGSCETELFQRFAQFVKQRGMYCSTTGFYEFDRVELAEAMARGEQTVMGYFKKWETEGLIAYEKPWRGASTRLIGTIDQVDFPRLAVRRTEAYHKLDQVLAYHAVPNREKHKYLENHFGVFENG